jgi:DNA-binding response OmpR family regulator
MDDYISKPIRPDALNAVLSETARRTGSAPAEVGA